MDPAFWNALPAVIGAVCVGFATIVGAIGAVIVLLVRLRWELKDNTKETVAAKAEVMSKVDSSTKEVNEQTSNVARVATMAASRTATIAATAATAMAVQTKAIAEKTDKIEDKLNGGPGGLAELTMRVANMEEQYRQLSQGHSDLKQGHVEIQASLQRITIMLEERK